MRTGLSLKSMLYKKRLVGAVYIEEERVKDSNP